MVCLHNTLALAFYGQARPYKARASEPLANQENVPVKVETEISVNFAPQEIQFHIELADNMTD